MPTIKEVLRRFRNWWLFVDSDDPVRRTLNRGLAAVIGALFGLFTVFLLFAPTADPPYTYLYATAVLMLSSAWYINRQGTIYGAVLIASVLSVVNATLIDPVHYTSTRPDVLVIFVIPMLIATRFISATAGIVFLFFQVAVVAIALIVYGVPPEYISDFVLAGTINLGTATIIMCLSSGITHRALRESHKVNTELTDIYDETLEGWSHALEIRDLETKGHSVRVTALTEQMARRMHFPEDRLINVRRGAILHDVGKIGIPDSILLKPGKLTPDERLVMQQHTVYAYDWLKNIRYLKPALNIPRYHHERWDGTGYPDGLIGTAIPIEARMFAIIDVWDAMSSERPYHAALPHASVMKHIENGSGTHFDPRLVDLFLDMIREGVAIKE